MPSSPTLPPNRTPLPLGAIPASEVTVGDSVSLDAARYFSDPDGDTLDYAAESSDTTIATAAVHDGAVTIAAVATGMTTVTITASDPEGLSARQTLRVTVETALPTVRFATATTAAKEGGTVALRVMVHPPLELPLPVTYTLGVDDDGGTDDGDDADYLDPSGGTIEIGAGAESAVVEIAITEDDDIEPTREVLVATLDVPEPEAGYVLGHPNAVVLSIEEGVCDRTPRVRDEIVRVTGVDHCSAVRDGDLHSVRDLNLSTTEAEGSLGRDNHGNECEPTVGITGDRFFRPEPVECDAQPGRRDYESVGWPVGRRAVIASLREADFSELPNLRDLTLKGNGLSELPAGVFYGLHNLRDLNLDGNRLTELRAEAFSGLSSLWRLRLQNNGLRELPPKVFAGLSNLEVLYVGFGNELTRLPPRVFAGLSNLTHLGLGENRLKELPEGIFSGLGRLERLTLSGNEFTSLDAEVFSGLTKLTRLRLHYNQLTALPTGIFSDLSNLEVLNLTGNPLTELPPTVFSNLTHLLWLNLNRVSLTRLPPAIFSDLASLNSLFLDGNRLAELPKGVFVGLYGLKVLSLEKNPGSPFTLTPEVQRVDGENLLAPGPARVRVRLAQGAPFPMTIPLSTHGGGISAGVAVIDVGRDESGDLTVTCEGGHGDGTQVAVGPVPPSPISVWGVELKAPDPAVLCGTVSNLAPVAEQALPWVRLRARGNASSALDLSSHFRDPDGDRLGYTATSGSPSVVSASVAASQLTLSPVGPGWSTVTVRATDPGGLSVELSLRVTVRGGSPGSYDIELILVDDVTPSVAAAFDAAVEYWESILADTELPDVPVSGDIELGCAGITTDQRVETVDDILIVAAIRWINGPLGPLAGAAVCGVRDGSGGLPFMGVMLFDEGDLGWLEERGDLEDVVLHEIGHVLGIGTRWDAHGLLRNPSLPGQQGADTHFPGPMAIEAFDEAGGASYVGGEKVPVENRAGPGSGDAHWRHSVLGTELMTPFENADIADPLSAITIKSLADMGYTVDVSLAERFFLPGAAASVDAPDRIIPYGADILRSPIIVVDRNGRIVRMIPG